MWTILNDLLILNLNKLLFRNNKFLIALYRTAQKNKFCIMYFFRKCDQIRRKRQTLSHLLKKYLMENFIFGQSYLPFA